MKAFTVILILLLFGSFSYGQCNININSRADGVVVRYINPELVGIGNQCELGLSVQTNGSEYYLSTTVRYKGKPQKQTGDLKIQLSNNQSLQLKIFTSQLAVMRDQQVSLGVFYLSNSDVHKLKNSSIRTVVFKEFSGNNQIIILSQNKEVAKRHINCLSIN